MTNPQLITLLAIVKALDLLNVQRPAYSTINSISTIKRERERTIVHTKVPLLYKLCQESETHVFDNGYEIDDIVTACAC